ncbi:MAG: class II aldolase/adducin family protein [Eubacteriales bacterium]|nr:class II aldolase/adducin family protein [Eubacteriales bacterium]
MRLDFMHPADQLVAYMTRIYNNGLTTASGGNLSILDSNGHIWITPTRMDKGILNRIDMVQITENGPVTHHVAPSSELPFHQAIYKSRSNIKAVLHAHSPALIAFCLMRKLPNVHLIPVTRIVCGPITMAPYARMGSNELGEVLAEEFKKGVAVVLMENHGVVVAAESLQKAYAIFETLETSARIELMANRLGKPRALTEDQIDIARTKEHTRMSELSQRARSPEELGLRRDLTRMLQRAVDQKLFAASQGTISARMSDGSFLISPFGRDRREIDAEDLVLVRRGLKESGKVPSRAVFIHEMIYHRNPGIQAIINAQPPHIMAFTLTDQTLDFKSLPEPYIMLHDMPRATYGFNYTEPQQTAALFSATTPSILLENDGIIVTGRDVAQAYDRLEVAEFTARAYLELPSLDKMIQLTEQQRADLDEYFPV